MASEHGLTKGQIVLLSAITSAVMATAIFIGTAPPEFGIPKWLAWLMGGVSVIVVIFRDAYGLRTYLAPGGSAGGVTT